MEDDILTQAGLYLTIVFGIGIIGYFSPNKNEKFSGKTHELDSIYCAKSDSLYKNYLFEKNALEKEYFKKKSEN